MAYQYNYYDNAWVKTNKRMKNYRVYVQDPQTGDYYYQSTYFGDYKGGTVSIVCDQTGEEVYSESIN